MTDLREVIILRTRQSHINMEEYRRGHNGPDSKSLDMNVIQNRLNA